MKNIDWYSHYKIKFPTFNFTKSDLETFYRQNQTLIDYIINAKPTSIIEAGSGLSRDSLVLASKGVRVTLFDIDQKFLDLGMKNVERLNIKNMVRIVQGDLLNFSSIILDRTYDLVFHCGVLEHFEDEKIQKILFEQLKVVPIVIFTVPIISRKNIEYFDDDIYRRLLPITEWKNILRSFNIQDLEEIQGRHSDLLVKLVR
jgi:ubiquinone/menaquinone biosynthesis C-methylase UbiE